MTLCASFSCVESQWRTLVLIFTGAWFSTRCYLLYLSRCSLARGSVECATFQKCISRILHARIDTGHVFGGGGRFECRCAHCCGLRLAAPTAFLAVTWSWS